MIERLEQHRLERRRAVDLTTGLLEQVRLEQVRLEQERLEYERLYPIRLQLAQQMGLDRLEQERQARAGNFGRFPERQARLEQLIGQLEQHRLEQARAVDLTTGRLKQVRFEQERRQSEVEDQQRQKHAAERELRPKERRDHQYEAVLRQSKLEHDQRQQGQEKVADESLEEAIAASLDSKYAPHLYPPANTSKEQALCQMRKHLKDAAGLRNRMLEQQIKVAGRPGEDRGRLPRLQRLSQFEDYLQSNLKNDDTFQHLLFLQLPGDLDDILSIAPREWQSLIVDQTREQPREQPRPGQVQTEQPSQVQKEQEQEARSSVAGELEQLQYDGKQAAALRPTNLLPTAPPTLKFGAMKYEYVLQLRKDVSELNERAKLCFPFLREQNETRTGAEQYFELYRKLHQQFMRKINFLKGITNAEFEESTRHNIHIFRFMMYQLQRPDREYLNSQVFRDSASWILDMVNPKMNF